MDVCESKQALQRHTAVDTPKAQLVPAEKNNAVTTRHPRTREVSSRYRSPTPTTPSTPRRCPSPSITRTVPVPSQLVPKRARSVDRKRPSTPPSPTSPSTPVKDSSIDVQMLSRKITGGRIPESLWPSTMRSLSVSFQPDTISIPVSKREKPVPSALSDTISIPVSKREKPVPSALSERTLRPSSNVAHGQAETPSPARKPTPERKRSPLKGKNVSDQLENSKPVEGLHTRLIDQHRWPSRRGGKVSSNVLTRSVDFTDKMVRPSSTLPQGIGMSSLRRMPPFDGVGRPLQKSARDAPRRLSLDANVRLGIEANSIDTNAAQRVSGLHKQVSTSSSDRMTLKPLALRSPSLPNSVSHPPSPSRISVLSSPVSRGVSPSPTRPLTPPSRGVSPSRIRPSSPSSQSGSSTSVLSFIADYRKGKKDSSYIDNAHLLRLFYNRYLQWRFANAQAEAVLYIQKVTAERTLYNVWDTTLTLWDSVIRKRINLQQLRLELKLNSVMNEQMPYLDDWALLERDHISSLSAAVEDLEASTLRLPITGGARANIGTLKVAVCSAVDVMQAMGSSMCSLLSRVEGMNSLVSELAVVAAQERAMLDECEALLTSTAAMQVEEYSLGTHLMQMELALEKGGLPILAIKLPQ